MEHIDILIVEDEDMLRRTLCRKLEKERYQVGEAADGLTALNRLRAESWDLVLLDINLPDLNGLDLLEEIHGRDADLPVIMMTGNRSVENVVAAMKNGAFDYLTKPFNLDEVVLTVKKALEMTELRREVRGYRAACVAEYGFERIIGGSRAMAEVLETAKTVAESATDTMLLLGESGTGKNLVAQAIHYNSSRAARPFMEVTCTALPEQLLESELFGHERGAFTDARTTKKGLCELAQSGTLFLDEIGDMPLGTQAKLLGFLERRTIRRVGGTRQIPLDVRVIAATNQDMPLMIAEKRFRNDLYYRLNIIEITIPPLRDRREDIPVLAGFFVDHFRTKLRRPVRGISKEALALMCDYSWPGNVRELRNAVERAVILAKSDLLEARDFTMRGVVVEEMAQEGEFVLPSGGIALDRVECDLVTQALERTQGNQTQAARLLRISRDQLRYRMKQYDLG